MERGTTVLDRTLDGEKKSLVEEAREVGMDRKTITLVSWRKRRRWEGKRKGPCPISLPVF